MRQQKRAGKIVGVRLKFEHGLKVLNFALKTRKERGVGLEVWLW